MRHLGGFLEDRKVSVEYQRLADGRVNLVARLEGDRERQKLVFSGHMDVVSPGMGDWDCDPFEAREEDGRIIGRGAADMKGGVAAMAVAMTRLASQKAESHLDILLAITAGEEVDTAGARLMASSGVLDSASTLIVGEPTGLDVFIAEKGVLWLKISVHGQTAHGSMPHLGVNAISYMARLVQALESQPFPYQTSPMLGNPTVGVNTISGGVKTNVVADYSEATVDIRLVPGQNRDGTLDELERLFSRIREESGLNVRTDVQVLQYLPAIETRRDDPLVESVVSAVEKVTGVEPAVGGVSYGTDGAVLAPSTGAAFVICGPGKPSQAHQPNEYVDVSELEQAVDLYEMIGRVVRAHAP